MRSLAFAGRPETIDGRGVRRIGFEDRSTFPVPAACVVANGVRETLAALFGAPVDLRLLEPALPSDRGWNAIAAGAHLYRLPGTRTDAALVLRPESSLRLAAAAFGEEASLMRPLSSLEEAVLERIVRALAPNFASVCGLRAEQLAPERVPAITGFMSYFELHIERPVAASIGVALAREPQGEARGSVLPEALLDVEVEVAVRTSGIKVEANVLAGIEPGTIVPITLSSGLIAVAHVAGSPIARGECGVRGNRLALAIGLSPCTEGGSEPGP